MGNSVWCGSSGTPVGVRQADAAPIGCCQPATRETRVWAVEEHKDAANHHLEEEIDQNCVRNAGQAHIRIHVPGTEGRSDSWSGGSDDGSSLSSSGSEGDSEDTHKAKTKAAATEALTRTCAEGKAAASKPRRCPECRWSVLRPAMMTVLMVVTVVMSCFFEGWLQALDDADAGRTVATLESLLRYGTIPVIAAIIGYGTNVVALLLMFYPIEFFGYFPEWKIGCGLDLPLFGWQGVIPMKARELAEMSVDMMLSKLIKVNEIFAMLDPDRISQEVAGIMPEVIHDVVNDAGKQHCPKLWEYLPKSVRLQIEEQVVEASGQLMSNFMRDLQRNIYDVWDIKHCVVERMVNNKTILNEMFLNCGEEEFEFIRNSGFYLGFLFGLLQMLIWMFVKQWWILPLCGVFVGYFTNVVALKVIFLPVEPKRICGLVTVQGLFLTRQREVSASWSKTVAATVVPVETLMQSLVIGPRKEKLFELVDKHVANSMEEQAAFYKPMFLLSVGAETWVDFRTGICYEFRKRLPLLFDKMTNYAKETLKLEDLLRGRMEKLPAPEFERLLHTAFEQDEIKLILVGAILGAIVGFAQAVVQTPTQLGIPSLW